MREVHASRGVSYCIVQVALPIASDHSHLDHFPLDYCTRYMERGDDALRAQDVTIRIYNVAGREVANFTRKGIEGPNSIIWDGSMSNGAKATAGVYFYALDGVDFVKDASKAQKMILLGANAE